MTTVTNNVAYEIPCLYVGTIEANVDLSAAATYQFTAVAVGTASGAGLLGPSALIVPVSSGASVLGILQDSPGLAIPGNVMVLGVSRAVAGGTVRAGKVLASDAAGKLVEAASGDYGVAMALTPGASGSQMTVFLMSYGKQ